MLTIRRFAVENLTENCVTDNRAPRFSFALESGLENVTLQKAVISLNGWKVVTTEQAAIPYRGTPLAPFTRYVAELTCTDNYGETASARVSFETGRFDTPWQAKWISDPTYQFTEKGVSPVPMVFRRTFQAAKPVQRAMLYSTALGIYEVAVNGCRLGNRYFAPGFTSYKHNLQYQTYDVTALLTGNNCLEATVAGGWAVGSYVYTRVNRLMGDRQALLLELRITYTDGSEEIIGTDENWQVTEEGPVRMADLYDGETYDATVDLEKAGWHAAAEETLKIHPSVVAEYGAPVTAHEVMKPVSKTRSGEGWIYDFGQNFAGVVSLKLNGKTGQTVTVRHAEILNADGSLNTTFLRTAKATATYICRDGEQTYSPRFTYMGFRYISIEGIAPEDVEVSAMALYSDMPACGSFECSDKMLNRLQSNIVWGARSNLVDIPTDCPQRDERLGWTGDICVFSPTAAFNFNTSRFFEKWLLDVKSEQFPGGGIPNTVPRQGFGFPTTMPDMAVDWWDDAIIMVPWAEYQARGDISVLENLYDGMKRYVKAQLFWAGLLSFGKHRYIWSNTASLHFGDWVAPDVPKMSQWQARHKWTATASIKNCASTLSGIAKILGRSEDAEYYASVADKVSDAFCSILTDGHGKLNEEFQTAYVLPVYLNMFPDDETKKKAAANLAALVEKNDYCIGTGFPGTPYVLFALADNGQADTAFRMLLNTKCPSWLYEVRVGATTIWERWDGLDENGLCPIEDDGTGGMISYNHYASGAVGAFLYQRIAGIEPMEAGYRTFRIKPLIGGGLTSAKASVETPYGTAKSEWLLSDGEFTLTVTVPVSTTCEVTLPGGKTTVVASGIYTFRETLRK